MASEVHADLLRSTHEFEATINALVSSVRALGQGRGASGEDDAVIFLCVPGREALRRGVLVVIILILEVAVLCQTVPGRPHTILHHPPYVFRAVLASRQTGAVLALASEVYADLLWTSHECERAVQTFVLGIRALRGDGRAAVEYDGVVLFDAPSRRCC
jgi:hypothetical protein